MPTIAASRITFLPSEDGRAAVTVVASERRTLPRGRVGWGLAALTAGFRREARLDVRSPLGEGEAWTIAHRRITNGGTLGAGVPLVAIFLGTQPDQHGPLGSGRSEIVGSLGYTPSVANVRAAVEKIAP